MCIIYCEDQGLAWQVGIDVLCKLAGDGGVEGDRHDLLVELVDRELDFIRRAREVDFSRLGIDQLDLLTLGESDAGLTESGRDLYRGLVIDEVAVNDRL